MAKKSNKKLTEDELYKYLRNTLIAEFGIRMDENKFRKVIDGIAIGINNFAEECYCFKLFGLNFNCVEQPARIYRNVTNNKVCFSQPYYKLKVEVPHALNAKLKETTKFESLELPVRSGVTDEEYVEGIRIWEESKNK